MIHWLRYILSGDYREKCAFMARNPGVNEHAIRTDPRYTKMMRDLKEQNKGKPCMWPYCTEIKDLQEHHSSAPLWANLGLTLEQQIIRASDITQMMLLCRKHHL